MSAQRMSNADAAWLHMDRPTNLMVVNALLWFEEPVDADRVKEILRSRLVEPFPRFRQLVMEPRLGVGVPSWEDDPNFDLDLHVHHLAVPAPGDKRALEELVSDLIVESARSPQAAVGLVPRRRLRRRDGDDRAHPPLHRRWDRALARAAVADRHARRRRDRAAARGRRAGSARLDRRAGQGRRAACPGGRPRGHRDPHAPDLRAAGARVARDCRRGDAGEAAADRVRREDRAERQARGRAPRHVV